MKPPDFDQIARRLTDQADAITPLTKGMIFYDIKDALVEIWNAHGAADIVQLEALELIPDHVSDDALKKLDR